MKKILMILCIFIGMFCINVHATDYGTYQLIPITDTATVETENFLYRGFYFNINEMEANSLKSNHVIFSGIKNISNEDRPISVTIATFDADKKNIGTLNFCATNEKYTLLQTTLAKDEEVNYAIGIAQRHLIEGKTIADIKYIAILGDNSSCKMAGVSDYAGKTIDEIKNTKPEDLLVNDNTKYFIYIVVGVLGLGILIFIFKLLLTGGKSRQDIIRDQYRNNSIKINTVDNNNNQPILNLDQNIESPNAVPTGKDEVIKPELKEEKIDHNPKNTNNNDNHGDDLFNMYK